MAALRRGVAGSRLAMARGGNDVGVRARFLDHVTLTVADLAVSRRFYTAALEPLGVREVAFEDEFGYGPAGGAGFWIRPGSPPRPPLHIAFAAASDDVVDAFHAAALSAGGRDNGGPGLRPRYHAGYYAAYVLDPDGNNVEAVHHGEGAG